MVLFAIAKLSLHFYSLNVFGSGLVKNWGADQWHGMHILNGDTP